MSTTSGNPPSRLDKATLKPLVLTIGGYGLMLFVLSSIRHALFRSGAFDLGYHDQILYLLSQGEPANISFWGEEGYHFLGGHAEWIYYGLSWLYKLYADVHWLFVIQAVALTMPVWLLLALSKQAGLTQRQGWTVATAYLLYPVVFNVNLFDFHPEVMAVPLILASVLTARARRPVPFIITTTLILGCRASLSLLLVTMGIWFIVFERRYWYGAFTSIVGSAWFLIVSKILVPTFKPGNYHAIARYSDFGDSITEVAFNILLNPNIVARHLLTLQNLLYLVMLFLPVLWGLTWRHLSPLLACLSVLVMNLLSNLAPQKDLVHHYSLPILPFLMLAVISTLATQKNFLKVRRWMILWSLLCFAAFGKYTYFLGSYYLESIDTWAATREAMALIDTKGGVITSYQVVPHLTHRTWIKYFRDYKPDEDLSQFEFALLNLRHPGFEHSVETAQHFLMRLLDDPNFEQRYSRDDVYLFKHK